MNELSEFVSSKGPCVKGLGTSLCRYVEAEEHVRSGKELKPVGLLKEMGDLRHCLLCFLAAGR